MTNRNEDARQKHLWEDEQERSHTSYLRVPHEADEEDAKRAACEAKDRSAFSYSLIAGTRSGVISSPRAFAC